MKTLSRFFRLLPAACLCAATFAAVAGTDLRVVGLFSGRAVVVVEGRQHMLKAGQRSPEGFKLISADSESAVLEVDGERINARLDGRISATKRAVTSREFQIARNNRGMYTTVGSINGQTVSFLVDTGASLISMNASEARRLGIDYRVIGKKIVVTTASRNEDAWAVTLKNVKVGELKLHNVGAVVLEGEQPETTLLGMSFLGNLDLTNTGRVMTLRKKY